MKIKLAIAALVLVLIVLSPHLDGVGLNTMVMP